MFPGDAHKATRSEVRLREPGGRFVEEDRGPKGKPEYRDVRGMAPESLMGRPPVQILASRVVERVHDKLSTETPQGEGSAAAAKREGCTAFNVADRAFALVLVLIMGNGVDVFDHKLMASFRPECAGLSLRVVGEERVGGPNKTDEVL